MFCMCIPACSSHNLCLKGVATKLGSFLAKAGTHPFKPCTAHSCPLLPCLDRTVWMMLCCPKSNTLSIRMAWPTSADAFMVYLSPP